MIPHPAMWKATVAGGIAAVSAAVAFFQGAHGETHLFEIFVGAGLSMIGVLLIAAWNDLKARDKEAQDGRRRINARLDRQNVRIARIMERLRMHVEDGGEGEEL